MPCCDLKKVNPCACSNNIDDRIDCPCLMKVNLFDGNIVNPDSA